LARFVTPASRSTIRASDCRLPYWPLHIGSFFTMRWLDYRFNRLQPNARPMRPTLTSAKEFGSGTAAGAAGPDESSAAITYSVARGRERILNRNNQVARRLEREPVPCQRARCCWAGVEKRKILYRRRVPDRNKRGVNSGQFDRRSRSAKAPICSATH
jgi:hypothetical protein